MKPFHALVIFEFQKSTGWRVHDFEEIGHAKRPLPLNQFSINKGDSLLGICGTFSRMPRRGRWCKRPDQELIHAGEIENCHRQFPDTRPGIAADELDTGSRREGPQPNRMRVIRSTSMNKPCHATHAEELLSALNEIDRLKGILNERAYLHPMNMGSNIQNLQALIPAHCSITIGKEAITFRHLKLDVVISCHPDEVSEALKNCEFLKERLSDE
jgi:hypothetical protein